ncbi:hypothetical protein M407DRAFT_22675 [Tulasnella calospora MUT 4182]|uniref:Protein kinase domain-containing protein n=1 Tax=Tulasnella calospora MUT 4182 TaxID=1051891 RepID=A0A0C3M3E0_9AGAM|nr:hypothetical protein M407DRAFT_22675 [Tulasnella calospora MUT 4182]
MQENKDYAIDPSQGSGSGQENHSSVPLLSSKLRSKLEKLAEWRIHPSLIEFPGDITNEPPSLEASNPQSDSDTQKSGDDDQGKEKGADGGTVDKNNDHTKGEGRKDNDEERKRDDQTSIPKIGDGLTFPEHAVDKDPDSGDRGSRSQSDIEKPEDDQQGKDEGTDRRIADGDYGQTKEEVRKDTEDTNEEQNSARPTSNTKIVGVKKLRIERDTDLERVVGLALRESEFLVELSHPNVVRLEGFVEDLSEHKVWLIFPWEEHGNLRDFLASGEWEIPERISLINDVTLGLEYLHSQQPPIYHGDLKSINILVNSEFHGLIIDFGSARRLGDELSRKQMKRDGDQPQSTPSDVTVGEEHITLQAIFSATASTITLTGSSYTLRWAAPELLQEENPCLRSDIWALGWIAYEVMTNTIPFHDIKKDAIVINHVIQGHLPSVTEDARMSLIRALCSLMVQCWSLDPDKRPTAEQCRKLISWMVGDAPLESLIFAAIDTAMYLIQPMIVPAPTRSIDEKASQLRRAQLLNELGHMYRKQADYLNALSCSTEALKLYTTNNDNRGRAETLRYLADVHRFRDEHDEAVTFYSKALQIYTDLGDENEKAGVIFGLADAHRLRHEYSEAAKLYSESLEVYTSTGDKRARATSLWGLATVHQFQGEHSEAINLYSEALHIFTDVGDLRERANTLWGLAEVHRVQREYDEGSKRYSEAAQIYTDVGDPHGRATTLWSLAEVLRVQHDYDEAIRLYSEAMQIFTDVGDHKQRAATLWGLAEVHRVKRECDEAIKLYSEATQILADIGDRHWGADGLMGLAQTHQMQDHHNEAISFYTKASEVLAEIGQLSRASDASECAAKIRKSLEGALEGLDGTVEVENETFIDAGV